MQSQGRNFPAMLKGILGSDVLWLQILKLLFLMFNNVACSEKKKKISIWKVTCYMCVTHYYIIHHQTKVLQYFSYSHISYTHFL